MYRSVIFLVLLVHLPHVINYFRTCVSNTYFLLNGHLCYCDYRGRWTEANCKTIARKHNCQPGEIIWQGCNQCLCKDNGQLYCSSAYCYNNITKSPLGNEGLLEYGTLCTPLRSYYVNCSICTCPESGRASEAMCSVDTSCYLDSHRMDILTIAKKNRCIPNVMYLFPCVQCLCSKNGFFLLNKCIETCQLNVRKERRCIPGTLYRDNCSVCRCPNSSIPDEKACIKSECSIHSKSMYFNYLRTATNRCVPRTFTKPVCLFCDCTLNGTVNENSCLELDCSKTLNFKNYNQKDVCSSDELVPICMQCFCFNNGYTNETYCTRNCLYQSKVNILEKVLSHIETDSSLLEKNKIKEILQNDKCEPDSLYLNNGRYCLCPRDNDYKDTYCASIVEHPTLVSHIIHLRNNFQLEVNASCEPNTFVDFDCNTCYCNKKGMIEPKWCTYDDCEAKRKTQESHKSFSSQDIIDDPNGTCVPGSISKVKCNYCICPETGLLRERACTKNTCFDNTVFTDNKFTCDPLSYYEVDCNICFCPRDGLKNVDKCTKNLCGKSFLRSNDCVSGQLFSHECNVCVCPPNGDKADKVCGNSTCGILTWDTFRLKQSLLENQIYGETSRNLDLCFPGEEFSRGCDLCVCSELGLKIYASCEPILCDNKNKETTFSSDMDVNSYEKLSDIQRDLIIQRSNRSRVRRDIHDKCFMYNISHSAERKECTPGSMYIIRCKQCICPYVGNINNFCRPLPKSFHCEQAFPGFNYLSMGRRKAINATTKKPTKEASKVKHLTVTVKHLNHTTHKCEKPGKVTDECFICECEDANIILEEHCYKSDAENCVNARPSFLPSNKVGNA